MRVAALDLVEHGDRFEEEGLPTLPIAEALKTSAAKDSPPRFQALTHRFNRRSRTQREPTKVEIGYSQTLDQLAKIAGENAAWVMLAAMRLAAQPMRPEVGHDHTEAIARNARCMAEPDPVHVCIGEQSMEQDD